MAKRIGSETEGAARGVRSLEVGRFARRRPVAGLISIVVALWAWGASTKLAQAAGPLPSGGHFIAGSGSIGGNAGALTIDQATSRGVIEWSSFSIGGGNRVTFNNGAGATLNRVTGGDPSAIYGTLSATGSVYLINPQGILIGPSGVVSTGGRFVASTLDTCTCGFMKGHPLTFKGNSNASIINLGTVGSTGGDVMLISSNSIVNAGRISAPHGTAEMAVGQKVLLQDSSTGRQVFVQSGSGGNIENAGPVDAAQISLQAADGNIFALAGEHTTLRATGTATRGGHVWLVADTGAVALGGTIEAKNADGSGGTVDTHGALLELGADGIKPLVKAGKWNVSTPDLTIDDAAAATFARSLNAGTSIDAQATAAQGGTGDVDVMSSIHWNGAASLTLGAYHSLTIEDGATIKNHGAGNLTLNADASAIDNGGSVINHGAIDWSKSTGIVSAYFDMNGTYVPGMLFSNAAWAPPTYSGLAAQITGYELVNTLSDLGKVPGNPAGNYALGRDIEAGGAYIEPLADTQPFSGQFDGRGHAIDQPGLYAPGLFGVIGKTGAVRNLGLTNMSPYCVDWCINGNLAEENDGTISRVYTTGRVSFILDPDSPTSRTSDLGGLVGTNFGTIAQSWSSATVMGATDIDIAPGAGQLGGLVSSNYGTITQSYATGDVRGGSASTVGGLVGGNYGSVTQSFATGFSQGGSTGGVIGSGAGGSHDDYWNVQTTGVNVGGGGVPSQNGLATAQMSNPASFVGWDFGAGGAWAMPSGATHPVLQWQLQAQR